MENPLSQEWFWGMMQFIAVTVSLVAIYWQIRLQRATHIISAMTIFDNKWQSEQFLRARYKYCDNYVPDRKDDDPLADLLCPFFEDLGTYVRRKALPIDVVFEYFSYAICNYWYMSKRSIDDIRAKNNPSFYTEFEYLHSAIKRHAESRGISLDPVDGDGEKFRKFEMQRATLLLNT